MISLIKKWKANRHTGGIAGSSGQRMLWEEERQNCQPDAEGTGHAGREVKIFKLKSNT